MEGNPLNHGPRIGDLDFERERLRRQTAELLTVLNEADAEQDGEKCEELDIKAVILYIGLTMEKKFAELVMDVRKNRSI